MNPSGSAFCTNIHDEYDEGGSLNRTSCVHCHAKCIIGDVFSLSFNVGRRVGTILGKIPLIALNMSTTPRVTGTKTLSGLAALLRLANWSVAVRAAQELCRQTKDGLASALTKPRHDDISCLRLVDLRKSEVKVCHSSLVQQICA